SWTEIRDQIARIGDFIAIPASVAFLDTSVREKLSWAETLTGRPRRQRPSAVNTVLVQGPVVKAVTAQVLRILIALNPDNLVLLSTWNDTDPGLLSEASAVADHVVTSARPRRAGVQNRNLQIVSTRAGVERAIELGARTI